MKNIGYLVLGSILFLVGTFAHGGQKIDYKVGNDSFEGYLSKVEGKNAKSRGVVILIHDWDGLTDYEVKRADMLAKQGYDTFALDLYGKGNRPKETKMKKAETGKLYKNRALMRERIIGSIQTARKYAKGHAVVMGYCFGGAAVLELARSGADKSIKGFATFHGGLKTPEGQTYKNSAPIFISHGGADSGIPMEDVMDLAKTLEKEGVTYDLEVYSGAPHAFTVFGSPKYRKHADEKSWNSFMGFLGQHLK